MLENSISMNTKILQREFTKKFTEVMEIQATFQLKKSRKITGDYALNLLVKFN
jgi:hypothetical protein